MPFIYFPKLQDANMEIALTGVKITQELKEFATTRTSERNAVNPAKKETECFFGILIELKHL